MRTRSRKSWTTRTNAAAVLFATGSETDRVVSGCWSSELVPSLLVEELALERAEIFEHEQRARALWASRFYSAAQHEMARAVQVRNRLRELEAKRTRRPGGEPNA
jgi:hypothetical protein